MPVCPPGSTSQPKSGVAGTILANAGYAEAIALTSGAEWLSPWVSVLGQLAYNTVTLCQTDPPGYPTLVATDFTDAITWSDPLRFITAIGKLRQWVDTFSWYLNCTCSPAGAPTNPLPAPITNMPARVGSPATPCFQSTQFSTPLAPSNGLVFNRLGDNLAGGPAAMWQVPITGVYGVVSHGSQAPGGPTATWQIQINNPNFTTVRTTVTTTTTPGQTKTLFVPTAAGDVFAHQDCTMGAGTGTNTMTSQLFAFCNNGQPGINQAACCPPDPALLGAINQILAQVTLLQKYKVPFAYSVGAAHSGLSGTGTLTVPSGLLGLRMELTTDPIGMGEEAANPNLVFDAGWWSVETVDSVVDERRVRYRDQFWFPPFMSTVTRVGYSLPAGAIARVTELEPAAA